MKRCLLRVVRGGSWYNYPRRARVADHYGDTPGYRGSLLGLRLVRSKR
jgi:formylglycine-generating enzyme required for sulfatase activity